MAAAVAQLIPAYARLYTLADEVEALVRGGDRPGAERSLYHFASGAGESPRFRIPMLVAQAALAEAAGDRETATDDRRAALALAESLGLPLVRRKLETALAGRTGQ
jgi:hypothetical protein